MLAPDQPPDDGWYRLGSRCACGCWVGRLRLDEGTERLLIACADCDVVVMGLDGGDDAE